MGWLRTAERHRAACLSVRAEGADAALRGGSWPGSRGLGESHHDPPLQTKAAPALELPADVVTKLFAFAALQGWVGAHRSRPIQIEHSFLTMLRATDLMRAGLQPRRP